MTEIWTGANSGGISANGVAVLIKSGAICYATVSSVSEAHSSGNGGTGNMLMHGDNSGAFKTLLPF